MLEKIVNNTKLEVRPYQFRIAQKTLDCFNGVDQPKPMRSVMIESPTGSGKTSMALMICKTFQQQIDDLHIAWVAMRRNLLAQAANENVKHGINVENFHQISMFDKFPADVVKAKKAGKKVLLVVDEAQHDAASSMAHLHNLIRPDHILGMTATPFRTDRMRLVFDKVIKDIGIHQLIQDGYLSKFEHFTIPRWDVETITERYCAEPERWGKSIFYMKNLKECGDLHDSLAARGYESELVDGSSDWETQLDRFRNGECNRLINCMKLTEGFDEPKLQTAWVRDSGKGCTIQMGGRVFRKNGQAVKQIVQSRNTKWPFIRTAIPLMQYTWEGEQWMSLRINPKINEINRISRTLIASTEVKMPDFIVKNAGKSKINPWKNTKG